MARIRRIVRRVLPLGARRSGAAALVRFRLSVARGAARLVSRQRPVIAGIFHEHLDTVVRLDHPVHDIRLSVTSEIEASVRAFSCAKEPETVEWLESTLGRGDVLYDIGANVGAYSLLADCIAGGDLTVYAFEPSFSTFAQLNRNIQLNGCEGRVVPLNIALSDRTAMGEFAYSSTAAGSSFHGAASSAYRQPVLLHRLDELVERFGLRPPTHLKLDVDGPELAILRGADRTLDASSLRTLLVEVPSRVEGDEHIAPLLAGKGFELRSQHPHGSVPTGPENWVFARPA